MIPDSSELLVRMMVMMALVIRKVTGAQTIQVHDLFCVAKIYPDSKVIKIPPNIDVEWNVFNLLILRWETSRSSL